MKNEKLLVWLVGFGTFLALSLCLLVLLGATFVFLPPSWLEPLRETFASFYAPLATPTKRLTPLVIGPPPTLQPTIIPEPSPTARIMPSPIASPALPPTSTSVATRPVTPFRPTPTATPELVPTPTFTPSPTPTVPSKPLPRCPNPHARITYPYMDEWISGVVPFKGSADIPNFQYYKFEYRPFGEKEWRFLVRFDRPVTNGTLMEWHTYTVPPGRYEVRLTVVDKTGNYPEPCIVRVYVYR